MTKWQAIFVLVLLVGVGAFVGWDQYRKHALIVHQFDGLILQKTPTLLTMKGYYFAEGHGELQNQDRQQEVQVALTPQTVYRKTSIYLPTIAQVQAMGGSYKMEDLPRDLASGSYDDLSSDSPITIHTTANIAHHASFAASVVEYIVRVYPKE